MPLFGFFFSWSHCEVNRGSFGTDVLLPSLYHRVPVVAYRAPKFDPEDAFRLMKQYHVRNAFIPPTALKLMRQVSQPQRFGLKLRRY